MFIRSNALSGSRRHRLVMGGMLTPFMALMGVTFSIVAANTTDRPLPMSGFAAVALSAFAVAWWCARYWYAALRETPEPNPWPWILPPLVLIVIFTVSGIGALQDGKKANAIGMLVLAGVLFLPFVRRGRSGPGRLSATPLPQAARTCRGPEHARAATAVPCLGIDRLRPCPPRRPATRPGAGTRQVRARCRAKKRTALSTSNLGSSLCAPALACNDFSFEAKASNSARPDCARDVLVVPLEQRTRSGR